MHVPHSTPGSEWMLLHLVCRWSASLKWSSALRRSGTKTQRLSESQTNLSITFTFCLSGWQNSQHSWNSHSITVNALQPCCYKFLCKFEPTSNGMLE
jgi:hypothetical protein